MLLRRVTMDQEGPGAGSYPAAGPGDEEGPSWLRIGELVCLGLCRLIVNNTGDHDVIDALFHA